MYRSTRSQPQRRMPYSVRPPSVVTLAPINNQFQTARGMGCACDVRRPDLGMGAFALPVSISNLFPSIDPAQSATWIGYAGYGVAAFVAYKLFFGSRAKERGSKLKKAAADYRAQVDEIKAKYTHF